MTTPTVQTLGPADPNAPIAQKFYAVLTVLSGLISTASVFGMVTGEQAASLGQVATTGTALVTAVGTAIAAFRTRKQINNGTFDNAPPPVIVTQSPITNAFQNVAELKDHLDTAVADSVTKVQDAVGVIQGAVSLLPGIGGVTEEAADLVNEFLGAGSSHA